MKVPSLTGKMFICLLIEMVLLSAIFVVISRSLTSDLTKQQNNRAYVAALCNWSHTHYDGSLEQRCREAQDKTHTEYLCVTRSTDLNCWVEVK